MAIILWTQNTCKSSSVFIHLHSNTFCNSYSKDSIPSKKKALVGFFNYVRETIIFLHFGNWVGGARNCMHIYIEGMCRKYRWKCKTTFISLIRKLRKSGRGAKSQTMLAKINALLGTSMTRASSSSSVGFCPMDRMTPSSSFVEMVPLPS